MVKVPARSVEEVEAQFAQTRPAVAFQNVRGVSASSFGGAEGAALSEVGEELSAAADEEVKIALDLQNRREAVDRADILNEYTKAADDLFRNANSQTDLSKGENLQQFGLQLNELRKQALTKWGGSESGGLILDERLAASEGARIAASAKEAALIGQAKVEAVVGSYLNTARSAVTSDPEILDEQIAITLKRAREDFGAFDPKQELEYNRVIPATLADAAVSSYILGGKINKAEELLKRPEFAAAIGETRQRQLSKQIGLVRTAKAKAIADARSARVKGVPRDIFDNLTSGQKLELLGVDKAEGEILSEADTTKAGLPKGTVAQRKASGDIEILHTPEKDLVRVEAEAEAKRKGALTANRKNVESILRASGASPLGVSGIPLFAGDEKGSSATRDIARLLTASRNLLVAGETSKANALLAQAKFIADNSADIKQQRELDKPVSAKLASDLGIPLGTTLREVTSLIPKSPEERAESTAEASATGAGRVKARGQLAFISQARETITDFLDAVEDDPGIVGVRGSLRATGQTAVGVIGDLGLDSIVDAAKSIALTDTDASSEDFEGWFDNPKLSVLKVFENSVGLVLARLRTPQGRVPVEVIKRSIDDVKLSGFTSTEQVQNRLNFVLNVLATRERNLKGTFGLGPEGEPSEAGAPTHEIKDGKLIRIE